MAHAATQSVVSVMYDLVDAVKRDHRQLVEMVELPWLLVEMVELPWLRDRHLRTLAALDAVTRAAHVALVAVVAIMRERRKEMKPIGPRQTACTDSSQNGYG